MNIVDINDIEDVIRAKINIDKNNEDLKGKRSDLNEFMSTYCNLKDIIILKNNIIPFNFIIDKDEQKYLFISNKDNIEDISKLLTTINYDMNNLNEVNLYDPNIYNKDINIIIHNNKYFTT